MTGIEHWAVAHPALLVVGAAVAIGHLLYKRV